jgi:hypothetical protein
MALFLFCAPAIHFEAVIENVKNYDGALPSLFRFSPRDSNKKYFQAMLYAGDAPDIQTETNTKK